METKRKYRRKAKPLFYVFKTTNTITGEYYIGSHRSLFGEVNYKYFGTGADLLKSIKEYGEDNHKIEILQRCKSFTAVRNATKRHLPKKVLRDSLNLNIRGNVYGIVPKESADEYLEKIRSYRKEYYRKYRDSHRDNIIEYQNKHQASRKLSI